ncbi:MAG: hypothetical protein QM760_08875 [Nibricoccus sp.]
MKLLNKFVSTALLASSAVVASAATPLLNLIGDQTPVVLSFNDVPAMVKAYGESPWAKTWADEQVSKSFAPLRGEMKFDEVNSQVKAETGHTLSELLDFATGDAVIAFTSADADFEGEDSANHIPFIAAIELGGNASKVEKMIEDARKKIRTPRMRPRIFPESPFISKRRNPVRTEKRTALSMSCGRSPTVSGCLG